jgi:hypothetical protein
MSVWAHDLVRVDDVVATFVRLIVWAVEPSSFSEARAITAHARPGRSR